MTLKGQILAADGTPLKVKLAQTNRRRRLRAIWLVTPLLLFVGITFLIPIADMLFRSIDDPVVNRLLPETSKQLESWDGRGLPPELAFDSLASELRARRADQSIGKLASRLNFEKSGMRSLITKSGRKLKKIKEGPFKEKLIKIDKKWKDRDTWVVIKRLSSPYTGVHYLAAIDRKLDSEGDIVFQPEHRQIYVLLWVRTLWISVAVTVFCLLLGYPVSYLLATLPLRISNLLLILVLLPFWTSLLVRTTSWIVLLQSHGVINDLMVVLGIIGEEQRIRMIYNQTGTLIAMTQILLPFMILPLYSVMKTIPPSYMRAAQSLGASPAWSFFKVYLPQTIPGIGAGSLLVFILAIGYYITPALVGGQDGQLISNFIAHHMKFSLNWGLAGALGSILLASVLLLYWVYNKIVGIENMKLG
ncbi:MAG: Spermidine/putrescine transport system permease protein PotB [Alphaproteobacteria bacterium MarineAlpha3_Bin5]|nr:ABC transporter permease [Magnetovibrio sp.]PPR78203.1 MAG: Spermidine/putrescine transport system permease protein PotB [Alphaproteobacteria bacterium MarineAlpha3_Bin5]